MRLMADPAEAETAGVQIWTPANVEGGEPS